MLVKGSFRLSCQMFPIRGREGDCGTRVWPMDLGIGCVDEVLLVVLYRKMSVRMEMMRMRVVRPGGKVRSYVVLRIDMVVGYLMCDV